MTTNKTNYLSLALEPGLDRPGSSELSNIGDKRGIALLEKFDRALSKRVSTKREQTEAAFKELFPRLLAYRLHGRTMKELLVAFNTVIQGNVCNKTFKLRIQLDDIGRRRTPVPHKSDVSELFSDCLGLHWTCEWWAHHPLN